jgi:Leucine-rich repeat (LRR) protein
LLKNLKVLDVDSNYRSNSPRHLPASWGQLQKLQVLSSSNNRIESIPEEYSSLKQLQRLILDNNSITEVPLSLRKLSELRSLSLRNNPIGHSLSFMKEAIPHLQIDYDPNMIQHTSSPLVNQERKSSTSTTAAQLQQQQAITPSNKNQQCVLQ